MPVLDAASQAVRLLRAHRARSVLTTFGIVWGTAAVIFLGGWGEGVARNVERGLFKTGRNLGEIFAGQIGEQFTPAADRRHLWFGLDDLDVLRRRARLPTLIAGEAWDVLPVSYRRRAINADVRGIEPEVATLRGVELAATGASEACGLPRSPTRCVRGPRPHRPGSSNR